MVSRRRSGWSGPIAALGLILVGPAACRTVDDPVEADPGGPTEPPRAKNIVFILGDGMGTGHVRAGRIFRNGPDQPLTFEGLAYHAMIDTDSLSSGPTDSAAAGTAMATGKRVKNGVVSMDADGGPLETILERAKAAGKATGIVSTTFIHDASPAAFAAHASSRFDSEDIIGDISSRTRPDVVFGGGHSAWSKAGAIETALDEGYGFATTAEQLLDLAPGLPVLGLFSGRLAPTGDPLVDAAIQRLVPAGLSIEANRDGNEQDPRLPTLAIAAIQRLSADPDGFFLFIENEYTDELSHSAGASQEHTDALMPYIVAEVASVDETVEAVLDWVAEQEEPEQTLVIVTADHETCGLELSSADYAAGDVVSATCTGGAGHTRQDVDAWATGNGSASLSWARLNTDLYRVMEIAFFGLD